MNREPESPYREIELHELEGWVALAKECREDPQTTKVCIPLMRIPTSLESNSFGDTFDNLIINVKR